MKSILILFSLVTSILSYGQITINPTNKMKVTVWDTYVPKKDGSVMHFDIIAPETTKDPVIIHAYGKAYLKTKGQGGQPLTSKECRRCHVREIQPQWEADIKKQGYFILEMENCN